MRGAFESQDYKQLADLAHWLKGSGANCGFPLLADLSKQLETLVKQEAFDCIPAVIDDLIKLKLCIVIPDLKEVAVVAT